MCLTCTWDDLRCHSAATASSPNNGNSHAATPPSTIGDKQSLQILPRQLLRSPPPPRASIFILDQMSSESALLQVRSLWQSHFPTRHTTAVFQVTWAGCIRSTSTIDLKISTYIVAYSMHSSSMLCAWSSRLAAQLPAILRVYSPWIVWKN